MAENWYIVLELEFDPNPVEDVDIINQRIDEKSKFWLGKFNDFNKGPQYRKYYQMIPEIRKAMSDEDERRRQIKEACLLAYGPLYQILKLIGKKGFITQEEINKLSKKQSISPEVIKKRAKMLGLQLNVEHSADYQEIYNNYYKAKPQNAVIYEGTKQLLKSFNISNLYEFLYEGPTANNADALDCRTLCRRALELKRTKYYKNDSISGSGSKLCGQCELTFKDEESKALYDNYLLYHKQKAVLEKVREIYDISGEICMEQFDGFVIQLTEILKDKHLSADILGAFCKIEKIPFPALNEYKNTVINNAHIKVCSCGCMNDVSYGRKICQHCGMELVIKCPNCGEENDANIKVCKCGIQLNNVNRAAVFCTLAENAIDSMDFKVAAAYLQDADKYWPNNKKVKVLSQRLERLELRIDGLNKQLREACFNKEYIKAKKHYDTIKRFLPIYKEDDLEAEIDHAITTAQALISQARGRGCEEIAVECCMKAYEICKDYTGIKQVISMYPPPQLINLRISTDCNAKVNLLSWMKGHGKGLVNYIVVKKAITIPSGINDGQMVGRVSMTSITDHNINAGTPYFYAVYSERAGVYSAPVIFKYPIVNFFEISNIIVTAGDGIVKITWDKIPDNANVEIYRITRQRMEEKLTCNNRCEFIERNLANNQIYTYRVCLVYQVRGKNESTEGIIVTGVPAKPSKAIENICIKTMQNHIFQVTYENPEKRQIQFYYSTISPKFQLGEMVEQSTVEGKMQILTVNSTGAEKGIFQYQKKEPIYVMAAVIEAGMAVIGTTIRVKADEAVRINEVRMIDDKIGISIDFHKDTTGFIVLYRFDRYPKALSDINTIRKYISSRQYQKNHLLLINFPQKKNYYFTIYAEFDRNGVKTYSTGFDYLFVNEKKQTVTYSIKVAKKLIGRNEVVLEFKGEEEQFNLPEIEIVSAVGVAPISRKSSKLLYTVPSQEVAGSVLVKIPLSREFVKGTYIKAFIKEERFMRSFQLKLKLKSKYQIN